MNLVVGIVLLVRFLLEVVTVIGLVSGIFIKQSLLSKIVYFFLAFTLVFVWARYGAPKSPQVLTGMHKLILEITVYSIGSISFYHIFGFKIGTIYTLIVVVDLAFMYALNLQGH